MVDVKESLDKLEMYLLELEVRGEKRSVSICGRPEKE